MLTCLMPSVSKGMLLYSSQVPLLSTDVIFVTSITSSACVKLSALGYVKFHFLNVLLEQFMDVSF